MCLSARSKNLYFQRGLFSCLFTEFFGQRFEFFVHNDAVFGNLNTIKPDGRVEGNAVRVGWGKDPNGRDENAADGAETPLSATPNPFVLAYLTCNLSAGVKP